MKICILMMLTLASLASMAQQFPEFEATRFTTEDDTVLYRLLRPQNQQADKKYPLVIFLHGMGERGTDNAIHLKHIAPLFLDSANRKNFPCFVVAPQCPVTEKWTYPDWYTETEAPMKAVVALIRQLAQDPAIDNTRIYITGLSMGGYGTWYLLTRYPELFAAGAPICGGGDPSRVEPFKHIPLWIFHGRLDDVVPVEQSRAMVKALRKAGARPRYSEYKKVNHTSWVNAYEEKDFLAWMFSNQRE